MRVLLLALLTLVPLLSAACGGNLLTRKYEYEEDVYLALDGSAVIYLNASVPALVALRGLDLNVDPKGRFDRRDVRAMFESPVTHVASLTTSRRNNRRYVHVRLEVEDVSRLSAAAPFAWSQYVVQREENVVKFRQTIGPSAARDVGNVGWTGAELVAFRLHLPSRVPYHNSPTRSIQRGNIIVWEQPLSERLRGQPLEIEVHMEPQSILARTLILFAAMVVLAALTMALAIWLVMRRGRVLPDAREQRAS